MENHHFIAGKIHYFYGNLFTGGYLDRKYEVNINQWNILVAHFSASLWGCPLWTKREKPVDRCPVISFFRVVNSTIFGKPHMVGDLPIYIYWNHQLQSKVLEYENTSIYICTYMYTYIIIQLLDLSVCTFCWFESPWMAIVYGTESSRLYPTLNHRSLPNQRWSRNIEITSSDYPKNTCNSSFCNTHTQKKKTGIRYTKLLCNQATFLLQSGLLLLFSLIDGHLARSKAIGSCAKLILW